MMRHLAFAIAVAFGGALVAPAFAQQAAPQAAAQQTPEQVVQEIAHQLDTAVAGHKAELQQNREKLVGIINQVFLPHFDVDYAAILVLGQHAREATPDQRTRFAKAFYNSITHRYAEGLLSYTNGAVKVLPFAGDLNAKRSVVRTQVATGDGKTVSVDFVFRKTASGEWKAYDVVIEGISYITNYRNQVDAEIRKVGLDQLIKNLQTQGDQALKAMEQQGGKANGG
ncbi:toluene tolerance protein [Rhodanobacter sp. C06]|uniref:MlaC/ttg2D family ABC transporter substrate-binding protein n=1 Tax=Rhodanobacter sp. C06 TaxID=1945854 RepID=UPI0009846FB2|nr:ABC transporter substrate-binding protein [Rhodanobacter sp. C06]OOG38029.1 toluene tolerance protein [Rhodanobacter sp. C06]